MNNFFLMNLEEIYKNPAVVCGFSRFFTFRKKLIGEFDDDASGEPSAMVYEWY